MTLIAKRLEIAIARGVSWGRYPKRNAMPTHAESNPFEVRLLGCRSTIGARGVPATGMPLMDRLWAEVKARGIKTRGINHWVYLANSEMFTGVETDGPCPPDVGPLEPLCVSHERTFQYTHRGPYAELPGVWPKLFDELQARGEVSRGPHLEIYGHWNPDPSQCETTIVIGLEPTE